jgi:hypothetical protein
MDPPRSTASQRTSRAKVRPKSYGRVAHLRAVFECVGRVYIRDSSRISRGGGLVRILAAMGPLCIAHRPTLAVQGENPACAAAVQSRGFLLKLEPFFFARFSSRNCCITSRASFGVSLRPSLIRLALHAWANSSAAAS